jgi:hypothetical protein
MLYIYIGIWQHLRLENAMEVKKLSKSVNFDVCKDGWLALVDPSLICRTGERCCHP